MVNRAGLLADMFVIAALFTVLASCALPPEYAVRTEFYPDSVGYSAYTEKNYKLFRVSDAEALMGYMLTIPQDEGVVFLRVSTNCILDRAMIRLGENKAARNYPIFQADWGQNLNELAARDNLRPAVTHFITNYYQRDQEVSKKGSVFSLF
ncbi:MAG: hypothetical protein LBC99_09645 [Spirochaetota bacterium]|jgi:hypothetical protein|nr:hypothetical protein [Spirochaetota bacterium]